MNAALVLVVVENDPDFRRLIRIALSEDPRIEISGEAETAEGALQRVRDAGPGLIILDHFLAEGDRGLDAAPRLKEIAPAACILLLSADDLSAEARREPAVDAFLRKIDIEALLPTAQRLLGLDSQGGTGRVG